MKYIQLIIGILGVGVISVFACKLWHSRQPISPVFSDRDLAKQLQQLIQDNDLKVRPVSVLTTVGQGVAPLGSVWKAGAGAGKLHLYDAP